MQDYYNSFSIIYNRELLQNKTSQAKKSQYND